MSLSYRLSFHIHLNLQNNPILIVLLHKYLEYLPLNINIDTKSFLLEHEGTWLVTLHHSFSVHNSLYASQGSVHFPLLHSLSSSHWLCALHSKCQNYLKLYVLSITLTMYLQKEINFQEYLPPLNTAFAPWRKRETVYPCSIFSSASLINIADIEADGETSPLLMEHSYTLHFLLSTYSRGL